MAKKRSNKKNLKRKTTKGRLSRNMTKRKRQTRKKRNSQRGGRVSLPINYFTNNSNTQYFSKGSSELIPGMTEYGQLNPVSGIHRNLAPYQRNNPTVSQTGGGKRKRRNSRKKRRNKRGGFVNQVATQASKLLVPVALLAVREGFRKSKSKKR